MDDVSNFIIIEWVILNSVLVIITALLLTRCYKERRNKIASDSFI